MVQLQVNLSGTNYAVLNRKGGSRAGTPIFQRDLIKPFVEGLNISGLPRIVDVEGVSNLLFPNLIDGFGRDRIDSDSFAKDAEYRRCYYSTCDIRRARDIRLPILEEDSTETGLEVIRASAAFKGNLWAMWEDGTSTQVLARKYDADAGVDDNWTAGGRVFTVPVHDATTTSTSSSFSHTTGTKTSRLIVVTVSTETTSQPTGITYNSVSLILSQAEVAGSRSVSIWYLVAPATGSNTVAITGGSNVLTAHAITFYNVDQSTPVEADSGTTGSSSTPSLSVTTAGGRLNVDSVVADGNVTATVGADQTELANTINGDRHATSYENGHEATVTMSWTLSGSASWGMVGLPINGGGTGVGLDIVQHKNKILALTAFDDSHFISVSTDGAAWLAPKTTPVTAGLLADDVTANEDIDAGLLGTIGDFAVAAIWDEDNGTITFFSSTDAGDTWVDEALDIASGGGPKGLVTMAGIDGVDRLYVGTREGIHEVDVSAGTGNWTVSLVRGMFPDDNNCILPGNRVSAIGIKDASSVFYEGPALEFLTKGGRKLSVTPKHPILTNRGWVLAQNIRPSDKLVCTVGQDEGISFGDEDVTDIPPLIEEIFGALNKVGVSTRQTSRVTDFHGDGRFMNGNVNIVGTDSKLRCSCNMFPLEPVHEQVLCGSHIDPQTLASLRALGEIREAPFSASQGILHGLGGSSTLLSSQLSQPAAHSIASVTLDIGLSEDALDNPLTERIVRSDALRTFPSQITLDDIIGIRHFNFSGHVYDLQTTDELYVASGVVVHNCRRMALGDNGALWFAYGVDDDSVPIVFNMMTSSGVRDFFPVPNDFSLGDGLPLAQLGPIRWMQPVQGMMYVSAGGGKSGRKASIFVHNNRGWSSMREHGTENQKIEWIAASGDDDGTPRLHYAIRTSSSTSDTKFLGQAFANPTTGISIKRELTGKILLPFVDAGFPSDSGPWLAGRVNAEDLSSDASGEFVIWKYGIGTDSGALEARDTATLGNFLSGTTVIQFPSTAGGTDNGAGRAAVTMGVELTPTRDAAVETDTPKIKDIGIAVLKEPPKRRRFTFTIDVGATMKLSGKSRTAENIVADWETAEDLDNMGAFKYGPKQSAIYVKVRRADWSMEFTEAASTQGFVVGKSQLQREGFIAVVLEEVA